MRSWLWVLLLSGVVAAGSSAQSVYSGQAPDVLAGVLLAADSTNDWATLLQLAHPDALIEFRESQVRMLEDAPDRFDAVDSCMAGITRLAQFAKQRAAFTRHTLDSVFQVPTLDSLGHLRPDTVFARYGRYLAERPLPKHHGLPTPTKTILGALLGPRETAYVLVQEHYDSLPMPTWPRDQTEIMTFRRERGEWRSMLDGSIEMAGGRGIVVFGDE